MKASTAKSNNLQKSRSYSGFKSNLSKKMFSFASVVGKEPKYYFLMNQLSFKMLKYIKTIPSHTLFTENHYKEMTRNCDMK